MRIIILLLFFFCISFIFSQTCDAAKVGQIVENYQDYLLKIQDRNSNMTGEEFQIKTNFVLTALLPCVEWLKSYVSGRMNFTFTFYGTQCLAEPNTFNWLNDPCCNPIMAQKQCCGLRLIKMIKTVPSTISSNIIQQCQSKTAIVKFLKHYFRNFGENRMNECNTFFKKQLQDVNDYANKIINCYNDIFVAKLACNDHKDCFSGFCEPLTHICARAPFSIDKNFFGFSQCVVKSIPEFVKKQMLLKYIGKTIGADIDKQFNDALMDYVSLPKCITPYGPINLDKTQCEALGQLCTDGKASCSGSQFFCGLSCDNFTGICKGEAPVILQSQCEAWGACYGNIYEASNQSFCEGGGFCNVRSCYDAGTCDQTSCPTFGECVGWPSMSGICNVSVSFDSNGKPYCPGSNWILNPFGCINGTLSSSECANIGGTYIPKPKNQQECMAFKFCFLPNGNKFAFLKGMECTKCGGVLISPLFWRNGLWIKKIWLPFLSWRERKMKNVNFYGNAFDFVKFQLFAQEAVRLFAFDQYITYARCVFDPAVQFLKKIKCDCFDKNNNCFSDKWDSVLFEQKIFYNSSFTYQTEDIYVYINNDRTKQMTNDNSVFQVNKTEVIVDSDNPLQRAATNVIPAVDSNSKVIGQVVGSGYSFSNAPVAACLSIDQTISVDPSYTSYGIAVLSNGNYVYQSSIAITSSSTTQICADLPNSGVSYFPIQYGKSLISSAFKFNYGLLLVILSVFYLLI